jgi:hypothetical protein
MAFRDLSLDQYIELSARRMGSGVADGSLSPVQRFADGGAPAQRRRRAIGKTTTPEFGGDRHLGWPKR